MNVNKELNKLCKITPEIDFLNDTNFVRLLELKFNSDHLFVNIAGFVLQHETFINKTYFLKDLVKLLKRYGNKNLIQTITDYNNWTKEKEGSL